MTLKTHTLHRNALALALLISADLPMPLSATEKEAQCGELHYTPSGKKADASYSASQYSEEHVGAVGISIFPGLDAANIDPHAIGLKLVQLLHQNGVEAACFVDRPQLKNSVSINYKINGLIWREGDSDLDITEAQAEETIQAVTTEAQMVEKLFGKNKQ